MRPFRNRAFSVARDIKIAFNIAAHTIHTKIGELNQQTLVADLAGGRHGWRSTCKAARICALQIGSIAREFDA